MASFAAPPQIAASHVCRMKNNSRKERFALLFYNARIDLNHWIDVKFIIDNIVYIGLALVSGGMLLWPALQNRGPKATTLQATQLINQGKTVVLDVREAEEFATVHIRDARHIPLMELEKRIDELQKAKKKTLLVVCQNGARSAKAVTLLQKAGFTDVFSLAGGLLTWQSQGLPVVKSEAKA